MNQKFSHVKGLLNKAGNAMKSITTKYYKVAAVGLVATSLCAVCAVSLTEKLVQAKEATGVMISLADAKAGNDVAPIESFDMTAVSYTDMQNLCYEAELLAQLETSEKQIEGILASNNQSDIDKAAYYELTATEIKDHEEVAAMAASSNRPAVTTYADENGTYEYAGDFVLTAYCACPICCGIYSNMETPTTASGTIAMQGRTIAADTSVFPFGTKLVINGQVYTVEDRGGAIVGNRIDIFFNSHQEALIFGRQSAAVYRVVE